LLPLPEHTPYRNARRFSALPRFSATVKGVGRSFLDVPFDQKANTSVFEFMGLMPARASPSRPLVSVAFGSLPTPRRFAVPCGPPLNAPLFARAFVPHEVAQGAWLSNQDERNIT